MKREPIGRLREKGTAALEAMLVLPFLLLLFMLAFNLGHAMRTKAKSSAAARLGALTYAAARSGGSSDEAAAARAREYIGRGYFAPESFTLQVYSRGSDNKQFRNHLASHSGDPEVRRPKIGFLAGLSSRQVARLSVDLEAPLGQYFQATQVTAEFHVDSNTWTFGEIGSVLEDGRRQDEKFTRLSTLSRLGKKVGKGLLWLFGGSA